MAGYRRVDYLKLAEEALREHDSGKKLATVTIDLPWSSYNGGKQFHCEKCKTMFDTSVGYAKHKALGCSHKSFTG
jgi:hypothetical protein